MADARGYTTPDAVAAYLGVVFTPAQEQAATALLPAVEAAIDAYTGHAWLTGPILGEQVLPARPVSYLVAVPVVSIEAVTARWPFDAGGRLLTADVDYQLADPATGRLLCRPWGYGVGYGWSSYSWNAWCPPAGASPAPWLVVDYTPGTALPAAVHQAATQTLADGLGPQLMGITNAVEMFHITGELQVKLKAGADLDGSGGLPADARALLDPLVASPIVIA
jgi:hypothetical protein